MTAWWKLLLLATLVYIVSADVEPENNHFNPEYNNYIKNHVSGVFTSRKRSIAAGIVEKMHFQEPMYVESTNSTLPETSPYYIVSVTLDGTPFPENVRTLPNVRKVNVFGEIATILVKTQSSKNEVLRNLREHDLYKYKVEYSTQHQLHVSAALDRIDQRLLPLDGKYKAAGYGIGTHIYIVDSGIRETHVEFTGRVVRDFVVEGETTDPCNFHGNWVTGLAGGATIGVASNATLHDLHVARAALDCAFYTSDGIDALYEIYVNGTLPGVINLSWQGAGNTILDDIIAALFDLGFVVVSAAGNANSATAACTNSPARAAFSLTVGAIDGNDKIASFSNYGNCVDIWAPGVNVIGASYLDDNQYVSASGTSGSTPLVAGVAAVYYSMFHYTDAISVTERIRISCVNGQVKGIPSTADNNRIVSTYYYSNPPVTSSVVHIHSNSGTRFSLW